MKPRLLLLLLLLAAQVAWLGSQYAARAHERDHAPTALIDCDPFDPRDLLRGHYEHLSLARHTLPLDSPLIDSRISFAPDFAAEFTPDLRSLRPQASEDAVLLRSVWDRTPVELVYRRDSNGRLQLARVEKEGSRTDRPREDELHLRGSCFLSRHDLHEGQAPAQGTLQHKEKGSCTVAFLVEPRHTYRFYVDEQYADLRRAWKKSHPNEDFPRKQLRVSAELILRPVGKPLIKQLYVNDLPWNEAYRRMERGDFPLTEPTPPES